MSNKTQAYKSFFLATEAGKDFVGKLEQNRDQLYAKAAAATDRDTSYANIQRARGITEVLQLISILTVDNRKSKGGR